MNNNSLDLVSQVPEVPAELKEWAENTAMGTLAGMLYCGGRQFVKNRREGTLLVFLLSKRLIHCIPS